MSTSVVLNPASPASANPVATSSFNHLRSWSGEYRICRIINGNGLCCRTHIAALVRCRESPCYDNRASTSLLVNVCCGKVALFDHCQAECCFLTRNVYLCRAESSQSSVCQSRSDVKLQSPEVLER